MTVDELDQLLRDRFDLGRDDLIAAVKTLPADRPGAATLTADDARLLDVAGLTEDPEAYAEIAADVTVHMSRFYSTAYTVVEAANGLGVNNSQIRQRRLKHTLWAIDDGGSWVYPAVQFEVDDNGRRHPILGAHHHRRPTRPRWTPIRQHRRRRETVGLRRRLTPGSWQPHRHLSPLPDRVEEWQAGRHLVDDGVP
jgi:hypothetical protein